MDEYGSNSPEEAWAPELPEERVAEEEKEAQKVTSSIGVIKDVLDWFETRAASYQSVSSINLDINTSPTSVMAQVIAAQHLTSDYESKLAEFKRDFAKYLEEADEE